VVLFYWLKGFPLFVQVHHPEKWMQDESKKAFYLNVIRTKITIVVQAFPTFIDCISELKADFLHSYCQLQSG
jgi:hypothetical protein